MSPPPANTLTRRDFLRTGAAVTAAAAIPTPSLWASALAPATADACIFLMLTGGPSQLDTWDPKPNAPADVRGPFRPIRTAVPGTHLTELFPKMAAVADRFSLVRSMHHTAAPIHETGFQLLNTGRLFRDGPEWPSAGSVVSYLRGSKMEDGFPPYHFCCPDPFVDTGINVGRGFGPGFLGAKVPFWHGIVGWKAEIGLHFTQDLKTDERFGLTPFGQNCFWSAESLTHQPSRFITVNMYDTVFDAPSWDCHADRGSLACDLSDYRDTVAPTFDTAFTGLLNYLEERGLLDRTLVVAVGEFGRTPHPNANGGRDHWPGCWTAILAGGGVKGGRVVGASDAVASEPRDRPVTPAELVATIYHALGVRPDATIPGPDGRPVRVIDAAPVWELF